MTKYFLLITLFVSTQISATAAIEVKTNTDRVTIYHNGAMVERSAQADLTVGTHELSFQGLSSKLVLKSLKVQTKV